MKKPSKFLWFVLPGMLLVLAALFGKTLCAIIAVTAVVCFVIGWLIMIAPLFMDRTSNAVTVAIRVFSVSLVYVCCFLFFGIAAFVTAGLLRD